jgi:hypothetical protein
MTPRSQTKRLMRRVERFRTVVLDFAGVTSIGQSFTDEVFRVFANAPPDVELVRMHATPAVQQADDPPRTGGAGRRQIAHDDRCGPWHPACDT